MIIRRSDVLKDSLNCIDCLSFDPRNKLHVGIKTIPISLHICINFWIEFIKEHGIDGGGLTREFFAFLACLLSQYIFTSEVALCTIALLIKYLILIMHS